MCYNGSMINTDDCWLYAGYKSDLGYGQLWHKGKRYIVHRLSYETFVGPIPDGLVIDHLCRVRHCFNPSHLEPVTARENTLRGEGVLVNKRKTHCPRGHEYTLENTSINSRGWRICKACEVVRHSMYYKENSHKWKVYNSNKP